MMLGRKDLHWVNSSGHFFQSIIFSIKEAMFVLIKVDSGQPEPTGCAVLRNQQEAKAEMVRLASDYAIKHEGEIKFHQKKTLEDERPLSLLPKGYILRWNETRWPSITVYNKIEDDGYLISGKVEPLFTYYMVEVGDDHQPRVETKRKAPVDDLSLVTYNLMLEELRKVLAKKVKVE